MWTEICGIEALSDSNETGETATIKITSMKMVWPRPPGGGRGSSQQSPLESPRDPEHQTKKTIYEFAFIQAITSPKNYLFKVALLHLSPTSKYFHFFSNYLYLCVAKQAGPLVYLLLTTPVMIMWHFSLIWEKSAEKKKRLLTDRNVI